MRHLRYKRQHIAGKADETKIRIYVLMLIAFGIFSLIALRLFQLQVFRHSMYASVAEEQHLGKVELPAKRGDILVKDSNSGEYFKVATNTTLDLLYVDPNVALGEDDPQKLRKLQQENYEAIAQTFPQIIFTREEYEDCKTSLSDCFYDITEKSEINKENEGTEEEEVEEEVEEEAQEPEEVTFKDYSTVLEEIEADILERVSQTEVNFVVLKRDTDMELIERIKKENLKGITVNEETFMVYADPTQIPVKSLDDTAATLAELLEEPITELKAKISPREVRYVFIKNKLSPETSQKIRALINPEDEDEEGLKGVVLIPEHWRFYPEGNLASQMIGFMNRDNIGQYGVEGYLNSDLEGKKGSIISESDPSGRQITVGETEIIEAVDGDSIVLTIDRIVQQKVEEILAARVEEFKADSGQIIVMNPFTGAIVAMANYPSFDPNEYGSSLKLTTLTQKEVDEAYPTTQLFKKDEKNKYVFIEEGDKEDSEIQKYAYENRLGPGVFTNKAISEIYEPGSTFKPIVMAMAIDANEVDPETTYNDYGALSINNFPIENSDFNYHGISTMTEVLEKSLNTGMVRVAQKLGRNLMYKYLEDFGLGTYTNIKLEGEVPAKLSVYKDFSYTDSLTASFGQGKIILTPLQLITAWSALANGGKLVQPHVVQAVIRDDQVIKTEPEIIHRVISEEASSIITSMLVSVVKRGHGDGTDIPGHLIAGKTGTAQVGGGPNGGYLKGEGSTITSFAGFFPALEPEFMILVKFDRPRSLGNNTWGSTTAVPTFRDVAEFIIDYYNIEPTE